MKTLTLDELKIVSGGREAQGAFNSNGPDRTRAQAMRENNPGRGPLTENEKRFLRNAGLLAGAIGPLIPGIPGRVISGIGGSSALAGSWSSPGSHGDHD